MKRPSSAEEPSWRSLGLSVLFHSLLVTIFLVWLATSAKPGGTAEADRATGIVFTSTDPNKQDEYLDPSDVDPVEDDQESESIPAASSSAAPEVSLPVPKLDAASGIKFDPSSIDVNAMAVVPQTGTLKDRPLTDAQMELIANDRALIESRKPKGPPTSISVFGSGELKGQSFLFLLDRSKSMGGGGLGVIQAARTELSQAINQLESYHKFQVVGYHDQTTPMQQRKLLDASDTNKSAVPGFISSMAAFGATNHRTGLLSAVTYKPDVIVLLTDGGLPELSDGDLKLIKRMAGKIQIHCVQFGLGNQQQRENFMTKLAEQNDGTFRYINVNDWEDDKEDR